MPKKKPTKKSTEKVDLPLIQAHLEHVWYENGQVGIRVRIDKKQQDLIILDADASKDEGAVSSTCSTKQSNRGSNRLQMTRNKPQVTVC
jgi:hypothetical protein